MRRLVEPMPSMQCELCHGVLLFKRIEPDALIIETEVAIYICVKCGHERSHRATHDPYTVHASRGFSGGR
jgi:hypothetical protein